MSKYITVYLDIENQGLVEIARYTSKGLFFLCLPVLRSTYNRPFDHLVVKDGIEQLFLPKEGTITCDIQ